MPMYKKRANYKRYLIMATIAILIVLMIISFSATPELTEIVLF